MFKRTAVASVLISAVWLASGASGKERRLVPAGTQNQTGRAGLQPLIAESGANVSVAFRSLDGGDQVLIKPDQAFPATSHWVEIPVMIELFAEGQARMLRLDDTLLVHNRFRSAANGSEYHLDPGLDPDAPLYREIGRRLTLRELSQHMMKRNSQLASNLLIERLGISRINARLAELHASGIQLRHGFQDAQAHAAGIRNTETARAIMEVLWALGNHLAVGSEASQEMEAVLAKARTAGKGPFSSQRGFGTAGHYQEALIVHGAHSFALAVIVQGLEPGPTTALIAKISHLLAAAN